MNAVDASLCAACAATLAATCFERQRDPEAQRAVAIMTASLAIGIGARALRNAGYVDTATIYLINPIMDMLIGLWALQAHRYQAREWTRLLILVSFASILASVAYGYAAKSQETKYIYAVVLNALLVTGLCGIGWNGLQDGLADLSHWLRQRLVPRRVQHGGRGR